MAYGAGAEADRQTTSRAVTYGYGLDDIQRARDDVGRGSALNRFSLTKKFQNLRRSLPGGFNQRGMIDSGLHKRAKEKLAAQRLMEQYGLAAQTAEAQAQLDRQSFMLEDQFYGGVIDDEAAAALRRFSAAQTIQGLMR